ncbi:MAG: hypothetical protein ACFFB3_12030 [Candidatus Hodarchaeota archaeon]
MGVSALDWAINSLAFQLQVGPEDNQRIQRHLDVLFDYFKGSTTYKTQDTEQNTATTWCGQLILKYYDQGGIFWEKIPWIRPEDIAKTDSKWLYYFPVEGQGYPESEIAKTIQTFLQLLMLEGYPIMKLSATVRLKEGPQELMIPRTSQ